MKDIIGYCIVCDSDKISIEEIAAEIQVTGISICEFKLCVPCMTKVDMCLKIIRTELLKDEWGPRISEGTKRSLRRGLTQRMKVRELKSAERRKLYFK